jgi:hypothetical protein
MYAPFQRERLAGALALHLSIYCGVGGCFGFGLYELLQPARVSNPGLAAYKPPPRVLPTTSTPPREVLTYGTISATTPMPPHSAIVGEPSAALALSMSEPETTGQSMREPQVIESTQPRLPQVAKGRDEAKKFRRAVAGASRPQRRQLTSEPRAPEHGQRVACIPRYDSSGAQTGAC